jgi:hypothetical protein
LLRNNIQMHRANWVNALMRDDFHSPQIFRKKSGGDVFSRGEVFLAVRFARAPRPPVCTQIFFSKHRYIPRMKIAAAALLVVASLAVSMVAEATPAHAAMPICYMAARHYRHRFDYEPPLWCWGTAWFSATDGHWDHPLPFGQDQGTRPPPPAPPSDIPPLPPGEDDEPPPP